MTKDVESVRPDSWKHSFFELDLFVAGSDSEPKAAGIHRDQFAHGQSFGGSKHRQDPGTRTRP